MTTITMPTIDESQVESVAPYKPQMDSIAIHSQQSGFTLIEVMVALAILAVVAVAASQAGGTYLRSVDTMKTRTLAHFVAQNVVTELTLNPPTTTGAGGANTSPQSRQIAAQGRQWQVTLTAIPPSSDLSLPQLSTTGLPNANNLLQPMLIQVAPINEDTGEALANVTDVTVLVAMSDAS